MRPPYPRRALVPAACALLLGSAAPALAATSPPAVITPLAAQPAIPSPSAGYSGNVVPGITGAAAQQADPPVSAAQRFAELNAASQAAAAAAGAATPDLAPWRGAFHGFWGIDPKKTIYGAQATQSLNPQIVAPKTGSQDIFAPTLDPSGIDTIEMTTIYDGGGNYVGAFNWGAASPGFAKVAAINSSFLATYATKVGGRYFYSVQDVQTSAKANTWTAYLYNYKKKAWDTFFSSSDKGKLSNSGGGWDMDEVYTDYDSSTSEGQYCTGTYGDLFESTGLKYKVSSGGGWTPATTASSDPNLAYPRGSDLGCGTLGYALPENSTLAVTNATHGAAEIIGTESKKCIDTDGAKFANGTKEQLWDCHNGVGQTWNHNADGELTVDGGKYCLDAKGSATANGTQIYLWACHNYTSEEWTFSIRNTLIGIGSGKCVTAVGGRTANRTGLELWTCSATSDQKWTWS